MSVKITEPCRFPFVCDPGHCDCRPSEITITLRNAEINARAREAQRKDDRWFIAGCGAVAFVLAMVFLVAANHGLSRAEQSYQSAQRV